MSHIAAFVLRMVARAVERRPYDAPSAREADAIEAAVAVLRAEADAYEAT